MDYAKPNLSVEYYPGVVKGCKKLMAEILPLKEIINQKLPQKIPLWSKNYRRPKHRHFHFKSENLSEPNNFYLFRMNGTSKKKVVFSKKIMGKTIPLGKEKPKKKILKPVPKIEYSSESSEEEEMVESVSASESEEVSEEVESGEVESPEEKPEKRFLRPGESKKSKSAAVVKKPAKKTKSAKKPSSTATILSFDFDSIVSKMIGGDSGEVRAIKQKIENTFVLPERARNVLALYGKHSEVEFRFGLRSCDDKKFSPGISKKSASILEIILGELELEVEETEDLVEFHKGKTGNYRKITREGEDTWEIKTQREMYEDYTGGYRVVASDEKIVEAPKEKTEMKSSRNRKRRTFTSLDESSPYYAFKVEITHTGSSLIELELEVIAKKFRGKYSTPQEASVDISEIFLDLNTAISESSIYLLPADERRRVVSDANSVFGLDKSFSDDGKIADFVNKPTNFNEREYVNHNISWYLTEKTDGVRHLLFINNFGVYLLQAPRSIKKISDLVDIASPIPCLLEVESISDETSGITTLTVFDVLMVGGKSVWKQDFGRYFSIFKKDLDEGLSHFDIIKNMIKFNKKGEKTTYRLAAKKFYYPKVEEESEYLQKLDFESSFRLLRKASRKEEVDGIILQDPEVYASPIFNSSVNRTFKWKPLAKLSIDFLARKSGGSVYELLYGKDLTVFKGTQDYPFDEEFETDEECDGKIIEVRWTEAGFEFMRIREDKIFPNGRETVFSVWKDMNDPFDPLESSENFSRLRLFHNQVKRDLLKKYLRSGDDLVDFGSGRGGDVRKWAELNLRRVLAVEPDSDKKSESHIPELKKRVAELKSKTKIIVGEYGAEESAQIYQDLEDNEMTPKVFSAFFCLTFFSNIEGNYEQLLETIKLIPDNGVFVGTVLNGKKVESYLADSKDKSYREGGLFMKLKGEKLSIKIKGSMVDYTEYLFDFDQFSKDMSKLGFKCISRESLDRTYNESFYQKMSEAEQFFSDLNIAFAFQKSKTVASNHILSVGEESIFSQNKVEEKYFATNPYQPLMRMSFLNAVFFCMDPAYRKLFSKTDDKVSAKKKIDAFINRVYGHGGLSSANILETEANKLLLTYLIDEENYKTEDAINEIKSSIKSAKEVDSKKTMTTQYATWLSKLYKSRGFDRATRTEMIKLDFRGSGLRGEVVSRPSLILDTLYGKILIDSGLKDGKTFEASKKDAVKKFLEMWDSEDCLITHRSMLGLLSKYFKVNIFLFDSASDLYAGKEIPLYSGEYETSIMLYTPDAEEYYPIRNSDGEYVVSLEEPLIAALVSLEDENLEGEVEEDEEDQE